MTGPDPTKHVQAHAQRRKKTNKQSRNDAYRKDDMSPKYLAEKHRNDDPHWPTKLVPQYSIKTPHNNAPLQDAHTHTQ